MIDTSGYINGKVSKVTMNGSHRSLSLWPNEILSAFLELVLHSLTS